MYLWKSLLSCFGSLSCISTNPWATSYVLDGFTWCCSCVISGLIQFALHLVQISGFGIGNWQKPFTLTENPPCFTVGVIQRFQPFHQFFAAHRPSYLTERFRTLIHQFKGLYSTALLSSLYAPWPIGAFRFINSCSLTAILSYRAASQSLITVDVDTFFHDFGAVVQWCL